MKNRNIEIIPASELEDKATASLLKRLKALLACEESYEGSEKAYYSEPALSDAIEFKDSSQWISAYRELKEILATREHIPRPSEKKAKRLAKAAQRKLGERRAGR